jgi:hypothetical protein
MGNSGQATPPLSKYAEIDKRLPQNSDYYARFAVKEESNYP